MKKVSLKALLTLQVLAFIRSSGSMEISNWWKQDTLIRMRFVRTPVSRGSHRLPLHSLLASKTAGSDLLYQREKGISFRL